MLVDNLFKYFWADHSKAFMLDLRYGPAGQVGDLLLQRVEICS